MKAAAFRYSVSFSVLKGVLEPRSEVSGSVASNNRKYGVRPFSTLACEIRLTMPKVDYNQGSECVSLSYAVSALASL